MPAPLIKMSVSGFAELAAALRETGDFLSQTTAKNALQRGMMTAAQPMADAMKANAPPGDQGDLLKSKIDVYKQLSPRQRRAANRGRDRASVFVYVGVEAGAMSAVGIWNEFGTDERFHLGSDGGTHGKSVGRITAHPFARPGFDSTAAQVIAGMAAPMREEIEKAANRARRKSAKGTKR